MDFWSRLIGGAPSSTGSLRRNATTERHTTFKHIYNALYQIWRNSASLTPDSSSIPRIRTCIDRLNAILSDESRGPSPHPCLAFAATSQVYLTIAKLALTTYDPRIVSATAVFFNMLIDAEVDGIVDNRTFSRALVDLARRASCAGEECEGKLVELIFGVANNIRLRPNILPAWFFPKGSQEEELEIKEAGETFAGATRKEEFPLFYLLLDYVHCAGRKGDFARTGLLYIIETASKSKDLERWLIESDMATLMATGLGGLYSQLGRILPQAHDLDIPPIIALSDDTRLEAFIRYDLGGNMDSFLSYLLFWQDAVDHCKSVELNDTLLDHFQVLFLEQLLYPSLLESSDVDGGSTPAVITYLSRILESIDQPELIHRILHFLLASPSEGEAITTKPVEQPKMSVSRRKSLDILSSFAEAAAIPSPTLFNLVDLVSMSIKSRNNQTLVATLRLITVIMQRHHHFASSLIKTSPRLEATPNLRTLGALNAELQQHFSFATTIYDSPSLDQSYGSYLASASGALSSRASMMLWSNLSDSNQESPSILQVDDTIFRGMLDLLRSFFTNNVITNLALTSSVTALASSNLVSLDGWLLVPAEKYRHLQDLRKTRDSAEPFNRPLSPECRDPDSQLNGAYAHPSWPHDDSPALTLVLSALVEQVQSWRESIPDFDALLAGRRELLHISDPETVAADPAMEMGAHLSDESSGLAGMKGDPSMEFSRGRRSSQRQRVGENSSSLFARSQSKRAISPTRNLSSHRPLSQSPSQSRLRSHPVDLHRRLASPISTESTRSLSRRSEHLDVAPAPTASGNVETPNDDVAGETNEDCVTLGHVLTNIVILYEFILELTALVQMRASMFQEVNFHAISRPL
ncbi:hypothetical protein CPC735_066340 [Coccidioides posadasii C735 delta SOWgp]|uniref:Retinoic acid induced 16-like family protein n=1 Tax=Coccidioides posadasii (strain C735) TaxID=222929 RepID=C5PC57_COCP7|nr:hypothetical protein CPC735_066340 [Coccidioides posadasii C735 delta SOWgp]EER25534.1 hypothetical protein CPC735_066340 [Coccidioides posadasii C735 delta SOWgp]|eukprot:XP_003067679.1 hypothetical protein CPC735_066340 [Coccidioides posadasii C735 delta SOWgp]